MSRLLAILLFYLPLWLAPLWLAPLPAAEAARWSVRYPKLDRQLARGIRAMRVGRTPGPEMTVPPTLAVLVHRVLRKAVTSQLRADGVGTRARAEDLTQEAFLSALILLRGGRIRGGGLRTGRKARPIERLEKLGREAAQRDRPIEVATLEPRQLRALVDEGAGDTARLFAHRDLLDTLDLALSELEPRQRETVIAHAGGEALHLIGQRLPNHLTGGTGVSADRARSFHTLGVLALRERMVALQRDPDGRTYLGTLRLSRADATVRQRLVAYLPGTSLTGWQQLLAQGIFAGRSQAEIHAAVGGSLGRVTSGVNTVRRLLRKDAKFMLLANELLGQP